MSFPSGVRGRALAASHFFVYIHLKSELIFGHRCIRWLQRWANRDKSGSPSQKRDKWASRENCDFYRDNVVRNWDCPGKSGTDSHLRPM